MIRKIYIASLLATSLSAAHAAETPWVEVGPDTFVRIISSDVLSAGTTEIALEVDMPPNTKTYWRIPGETGIPTQISLDGSQNIAGQEIVWPYPMRDNKGGYVDFVYYGPTVLPIVLDISAETAELSLEVMMGICDEICIPVSANFDLALDFSTPDKGQELRIRQAINQAPIAWPQTDDPFGEVSFDPEIGRMTIDVDPAIIDPATLIVDNEDPRLLFAMPQKSPDGHLVKFDILGRDRNQDLHGTPVRLTFLTDEGAFEVSRSVSVPGR